MENYNEYDHINIGAGKDITIKELSIAIKKVVGYDGQIIFDTTKPDGPPRKLLAVSKMEQLGWKYSTELELGLKMAYNSFLKETKNNTIRN